MSQQKWIDRDLIQDLLCRFIINVPEQERKIDRIIQHIQLAYWYYLDFIINNPQITSQKNCPKLTFHQFADNIFSYINFFPDAEIKKAHQIKSYQQYLGSKQKDIPVFGAIILNKERTKVLLVNNYTNTNYSFPKGKVNEGESGKQCAVREVWEEIGFNCERYISEQNAIKHMPNDQKLKKLYIVDGIDETKKFATQVRGEIGSITWVYIEEIMENSNLPKYKQIIPFMGGLNLWIKHNNESKLKNPFANSSNIYSTPKIYNQQTEEQLQEFAKELTNQKLEFFDFLESGAKSTSHFTQNPLSSFKLDNKKLNSAFE